MTAVLPVLALVLLSAQTPAAPGGVGGATPAAPGDSGHAIIPPAADTRRAADPELEALTRQVASELRCPVCQGLSINDSPAELAVQMKDVIRDQLAAGRTPDEVKAYYVGRYGEWVLLAPDPSGMNLMVYILPLAALVGGALLIIVSVRRWLAQPGVPELAPAAPLPGDPDDDLAPRR